MDPLPLLAPRLARKDRAGGLPLLMTWNGAASEEGFAWALTTVKPLTPPPSGEGSEGWDGRKTTSSGSEIVTPLPSAKGTRGGGGGGGDGVLAEAQPDTATAVEEEDVEAGLLSLRTGEGTSCRTGCRPRDCKGGVRLVRGKEIKSRSQ
jgi:hypothetical protein